MNARYPIMMLQFGVEMEQALARVLQSGWIMQGPEVEAFEREFAAFVGTRHACAVSSGTAGLHLALHALGVGPGDEVITVSHSFVATANSIRLCGALPVFIDIEPQTFNMSPGLIAEALTKKTKAILCVHQMGMPCDMRAVLEVAQAYELPVIEDAACAIGSEIHWQGEWQRIGRPHGLAATFSFHPRKVLTTGEGGMITTQDPEFDRKVRQARQHGLLDNGYESVGFNYRLTDMQAALGRVQLRLLEAVIQKRRALAERYTKHFVNQGVVTAPHEPEWARSNWQSYCIRLPVNCQQKDVMHRLEMEGIASRQGIVCAHREKAYQAGGWVCAGARTREGCRPEDCAFLQESEKAQDHGLCLPLYPQMEDADVDFIADAVGRAVREAQGAHS